MFAAGKSASSGIRATYIGTANSSATEIIYNFGDFVIPRAGLVVVTFTSRGLNARHVDSITIGGDTADLVAGASDQTHGAFGSYVKAAGTHNVTVTLSGGRGTPASNVVSVWLLENYNSATPRDSEILNEATGTSRTVSIDLLSGGVAFYGCILNDVDAISWSSATISVDASVNSRRHSHAYKLSTPAATGFNETAGTWVSDQNGAVGISFR